VNAHLILEAEVNYEWALAPFSKEEKGDKIIIKYTQPLRNGE
jgi:hypothetical protein